MRHGLKAVDLTERLKPADAGKDRPWRQSLRLVSSPGDQLDLVLYRNYKKREGTKAGRWDGRWGESAKQGWQAYLWISYDFYMRAVNARSGVRFSERFCITIAVFRFAVPMYTPLSPAPGADVVAAVSQQDKGITAGDVQSGDVEDQIAVVL